MWIWFELRRVSGVPFARRWDGVRNGDPADIEDKGGVPGPNDAHLLCVPIPQGL